MTFLNDAEQSKMLPRSVCRPPCVGDFNRVERYARFNQTALYTAVPFNYSVTITMLYPFQKKLKQTLKWLLHV
jgi:hypothetical protein